MSAVIIHRELRHVHPKLSPVCVCGPCTRIRVGWFGQWSAVLARLVGTSVLGAYAYSDDYDFIAAAASVGVRP